MLDSLFRTMAGESQDPITFRVTLPDGTQRLVRGTAHVIRGEDGGPVAVRGRLREVVPEGSGGERGMDTTDTERAAISVAIIGSDRLARLGIRSLLANFAALHVVGDYAPTPDVFESLERDSAAWRRLAAVIVDVGARDDRLADLVLAIRRASPGTRIVARIQPQALETVGWLAQAGVGRLLTSDVSDAVLAEALMDAVRAPSHTRKPPDQGYVFAGESTAFEIASSLSEAELRVLRMLSRGYRNREIAGSLFVSEPTVKRYTQQIYRKLGARDRAHAAALANRLRLG